MKKILFFLVIAAALSGWGGFFYQQARLNEISEQFQERITQIEYKQKVSDDLRKEAESKRMEKQFALQQEYQRILEESVGQQVDAVKFRQDSYQARVDEMLARKAESNDKRLEEFGVLIAALRAEQGDFKTGQEALMRRLEGSIKVLERFLKDELEKTNNQLVKYSLQLDNTIDRLESSEREVEQYRQKVKEYKRELDAYKQSQAVKAAGTSASTGGAVSPGTSESPAIR